MSSNVPPGGPSRRRAERDARDRRRWDLDARGWLGSSIPIRGLPKIEGACMTKHEHEQGQETTGASGGTARQEAVDAINATWNRCFSGLEKPDGEHALAAEAEIGIAHACALLHIGDQIGRLADELGGFHEARLRHALAGPKDRADEHDDDDEVPDPRPAFGRFQDELRKARSRRR